MSFLDNLTLVDLGNLGSFLGGLSAIVLAAAAIVGGSAGLGDWRAKQREQRDLAREQAESIRLDRRRYLAGWSPHGVDTFGVESVTAPGEVEQARHELLTGDPSAFVLLRVNETGSGNVNRAYRLRQLIANEGFISRPPTAGEYEALQEGRKILIREEWPN